MRCINCGNEKDVEFHHVIPKSLGGKNSKSNLVPLCYECHSKLHFGTSKGINHSALTKAGLEKAKKNKVKHHLISIEDITERIQDVDYKIDVGELLDIIFSVPIRGSR